jgi:curved DNA-binding protein
MRGQGIPNPNGPPGDLYAEVRIMVPPTPSSQERRLFEELAAASTFNPRSAR